MYSKKESVISDIEQVVLMYKITEKLQIAENTILMKIHAPHVAKNAQPGQFVILRIDDTDERIPLTIADNDNKGNITIVFLIIGYTTTKLSKLNKGDFLLDFVGPLGNPMELNNFGNVVLIGGGLGIAPIYPQAKALKEKGNNVTCIVGAKTKQHLFWLDKLEKVSNKILICTDDGSYGRKGFVTDALKELIESMKSEYKTINRVIAIGPPIMMKFISLTTKPAGIKTIVSINSIMVDGIGMCGGCRVIVDNIVKFSCVNGPEFDGHLVDWNDLLNRNCEYIEEEKLVLATVAAPTAQQQYLDKQSNCKANCNGSCHGHQN